METKLYDVPAGVAAARLLDDAKYKAMYEASVRDPVSLLERAWRAHRLVHALHQGEEHDASGPARVSIRWFEDGVANAAYNCIDRHLDRRGDQVAIIWEGDDPTESKHITYRELHREVCRFANVLRNRSVQKRRPRHDLPADDPRGGLRDARLRAARRHPLGRVRRLLAGLARRPHRGLRLEGW